MKKSSFFYILILSFALIFSCTNVTNTDVVTQGKKTLAIPTFNTDDTKVEYGTIIKFSYSPSDANLYYTTDGTEPDLSSKDSIFYDPSRGIELKESCTIKARLYHSNYNSSPVVEKKFSVYIAEPTILPDSAEITTTDEIALSHKMFGTKIYYTTDGSKPTEDLDEYEKPFALAAGTYTIKAIAVRGGVKSKIAEHIYTVIDANGAYLDKLEVVNGGKNYLENFKKTQNSYTVGVPFGINTVTIKAESSSSKVQILGSEELTLAPGVTQDVSILVTSNADSSKTNMYRLSITQAPENASDDSKLSSLDLRTGDRLITFSPAFSGSVTDYVATVDYSVTSVTMSFTVNDVSAVTDKVSGATYNLSEGENTLSVKVTAENKINTTTYTIKVTRKAEENSNANLKSVTVAGKSIPVSDDMTASSSDSKVRIVATPEKDGAFVEINDQSLTGVDVSVPSTVNIVVTAEDKTTQKFYRLILNKASSAELTSLTVNGESVTIGSSMSYTTSASTVANIAVMAKDAASITIDGQSGTSSSVTISADSSTAANKVVTIILTAADGSSVSYKLSLIYKPVITDRIIVHYPVSGSYKNIYAWDSVSEEEIFGAWPGKEMVDNDGDGWFDVEILITSCNLIFNNPKQTGNLSRTAGEWWYKDGKWTEYNPERPVTPSVKFSKESGTYIESFQVTISSTNSSGDVIYYTTDGTEPTASSNIYTSPITIPVGTTTLKAFAVNAKADIPEGEVSTVIYKIDANADLIAPVITANKPTGRYKEALSDISFTITDNKSEGFAVYYTIDGSVPNTSSPVYATCAAGSNSVTGKNLSLAMNNSMTVRLLAVDKAGNENGPKAFYYACSDVNYSADRWDPRQESIYFLLTARWFDGDPDNTIGDMNCSWTEARANDSIPSSEDGFTGPEDVTWRGDFKGLVEKMDYIKSLGFTCIWLTPIVQNRSPLCYHGYHAWNMYKEDARLVSDGYDFQRVIDEAHKRGMKICLDIVINHSGRFGLENFAEVKYNRNPANFPVPQGWETFKYDENAYQAAYSNSSYDYINSVSQNYPNGWRYDGLRSPGNYPAGWTIKIGDTDKDVGGTPIPAWADFIGDVRPFTQADKDTYGLSDQKRFNYPTTESYCKTIDDVGTPGSLTLSGYASSKRRIRGHNTGFPTGSGSFDNYPEANLDSLHEDCPDLNIENPAVQDYIVGAYNRYINMGVDMFRVDTVMHMTKETLNDHYWNRFFEEAATPKAKEARGGADFFIFGEVGNFVNNLSDKPEQLRQSNYVWDNTVSGPLAGSGASNNHLLNGNEYRAINKAHKAVPESDYVVSAIDIISHNGFCDGVGGAYGRALSNSDAYWDSTYLTWYTDSHDYGPNKGETRWKGDFAGAWSMLFTFRGIPIVYYGSEIRFAAGKPNDWPGGGGNGVNMSLEKTGRSYYGAHLEGSVSATDFGEYTASGEVATTLSSELSKHLRDLNRIRLAVPALQMGQYSTEGHTGGWAGYKRRYTGTNKITGESVDSYALVGVGAGAHSWTGVLSGEYVDIISGDTVSANGGSISVSAHGSDDAALVVLVKTGLATAAPGKVAKESPYLGF